jgi:hypothetical protein
VLTVDARAKRPSGRGFGAPSFWIVTIIVASSADALPLKESTFLDTGGSHCEWNWTM